MHSAATQISAVLLDIEGTTTSIKFVAEVLFPYIRREIQQYLVDNWDKVSARLPPSCRFSSSHPSPISTTHSRLLPNLILRLPFPCIFVKH